MESRKNNLIARITTQRVQKVQSNLAASVGTNKICGSQCGKDVCDCAENCGRNCHNSLGDLTCDCENQSVCEATV